MSASPSAVLEAARVQANMADSDVWLAYFAMGGIESPGTLRSFFDGTAAPSAEEYDLLAQVLNEKFMEDGGDHPVPYWDETD